MAGHVEVQKSTDHLLILRVVLSGLALEEVNAPSAQRDRDLDVVLSECKLLRGS